MEQEQDIFEAAPKKKISKILDFSLRSANLFEFQEKMSAHFSVWIFRDSFSCTIFCYFVKQCVDQSNGNPPNQCIIKRILYSSKTTHLDDGHFRKWSTFSR